MKDLLQVTGCSAELQRPGCDSGCLSERYRSITGECNNRSALPQTHSLCFNNSNKFFCFFYISVRLLCFYPVSESIPGGAPQTSRTPVGCLRSTRTRGGHLEAGTQNTPTTTPAYLRSEPCGRFTLHPVALLRLQSVAVLSFQVRLVSQEVLFTHNGNISLDASLSHLLVEWGQWIDHDVVHTPQSPSTAAFRTGADCTRTCSQDTPCFPIEVLCSSSSLLIQILFKKKHIIH